MSQQRLPPRARNNASSSEGSSRLGAGQSTTTRAQGTTRTPGRQNQSQPQPQPQSQVPPLVPGDMYAGDRSLQSYGMVKCGVCQQYTPITHPMERGQTTYPRSIPCSNTRCPNFVTVQESDDAAARQRLSVIPVIVDTAGTGLRNLGNNRKVNCYYCHREITFYPLASTTSGNIQYPREIRCPHCTVVNHIDAEQEDAARHKQGMRRFA